MLTCWTLLYQIIPQHFVTKMSSENDYSQLRQDMRSGFESIMMRLSAIDTRLNSMDSRYNALESRFTSMEYRFTALENRSDERFAAFERYLERFEGHLIAAISSEFEKQDKKIEAVNQSLNRKYDVMSLKQILMSSKAAQEANLK